MKPQASRADIMPVILGGDMSAYPMAREFHEAYGVRTTCVIPDPIRIIRTSSFIDTCAIAEQSDELIVDAVCRLYGLRVGYSYINRCHCFTVHFPK